MSYVQVWIHGVWGTKNRHPFMDLEKRKIICDHIKENAKEKKILIDCIDGYTDHLHCLFALNADIALSKHLQLLKGEATNWINKNGLFQMSFGWADDYFAASVSKDKLNTVRAYIKNQHNHHQKTTFEEEYNKFLKSFGYYQG
jgi:putative transposase